MRTVTITEAKNQLSALIDRVRHGETVVITDRGRLVARSESVVTDRGADPGWPPRPPRLLRVHDLRAADSLHLAAAFVAAESRPASLPFVCLDDRPRIAAGREGFAVVRAA